MSMHLDLDDLKEPPLPQTFQPHGAHNYPRNATDSVAAPVEKDNVLEMLQAVESWDDIRNERRKQRCGELAAEDF